MKLARDNLNRVAENMKVGSYIENLPVVKRSMYQMRELKTESVLKRREEIEIDNFNKKHYTLYKNQIFKIMAGINRINQVRDQKRRNFLLEWIRVIHSTDIFLEMFIFCKVIFINI
jgi:hypothetical protein